VLLRVAELAAELLDVHAMLCHFTRAKKNHRHVQPIAFSQDRIGVNIHFAETRSKLEQKRRNRRLGVVAEMTTRARIKRHFARPGGSQARVLSV